MILHPTGSHVGCGRHLEMLRSNKHKIDIKTTKLRIILLTRICSRVCKREQSSSFWRPSCHINRTNTKTFELHTPSLIHPSKEKRELLFYRREEKNVQDPSAIYWLRNYSEVVEEQLFCCCQLKFKPKVNYIVINISNRVGSNHNWWAFHWMNEQRFMFKTEHDAIKWIIKGLSKRMKKPETIGQPTNE